MSIRNCYFQKKNYFDGKENNKIFELLFSIFSWPYKKYLQHTPFEGALKDIYLVPYGDGPGYWAMERCNINGMWHECLLIDTDIVLVGDFLKRGWLGRIKKQNGTVLKRVSSVLL